METLEIKDKTKTKDMLIGLGLLGFLFILLVILEHTIRPTSILFTVLKKGAIYALVAVSMNLLNGFTVQNSNKNFRLNIYQMPAKTLCD